MKTIKIKQLQPGQEVTIANCRDTARVVKRLAKNLYEVVWCGHTLQIQRNQMAVNVHGRWVFGPNNATAV